MSERESSHPLRILQIRYTRNQILAGTASEKSYSAEVIDVLVKKGPRGIWEAYRIFDGLAIDDLRNSGFPWPGLIGHISAPYGLVFAAAEFFYTAMLPSKIARPLVRNFWVTGVGTGQKTAQEMNKV